LYIKDDPGLTQDHREAFEAHLLICPACAEEYQEDKQLVALLKRRCPIGRTRHDATAADSISQIVPELITAPRAVGCDMQSDALKTQLDEALAAPLTSGRSQ